MGSAKKDRAEKREKKKPDPVEDDDDDDDDDDEQEEEEEEVESVHVKRKRERGRAAFLNLARRMLALIPLALVLSRQPFMMKPRAPGVNSAKLRPLDIAISGAVHWAANSPTVMRQPKYYAYVNATARGLLTPFEYFAAQQSKRAMPAEKTMAGAYKKSEKQLGRLVDKDSQLREIATAPQPNFPLLGSYALVMGCVLCPLVGGIFEYMILLGGILLLQGGRQLAMEPQPEFYVAGVIAVLAIMAADSAGKAPAPPKRKRR